MSIDDHNITDLVNALVEQRLNNLWTSALAQVVSYDSVNQRANVQLTQRQNGVKLPVIGKVPVMWPRGADWSLVGKLQPGDNVVVFMLVHSIDNYINDGVVDRDPQRRKRFQVSSAVCFPSVSSTKSPIPADGNPSGGEGLVIRSPLTVIRETAGNERFVALAELVISRLDQIASDFNNHAHDVPAAPGKSSTPVTLGLPPTSPPVTMGPFDSVAATKLKAE